MSNPDNPVNIHNFDFGGLRLTTRMYHNGCQLPDGSPDPEGVFWNQELKLQSGSNSASFSLYGTVITPDELRKLADELEKAGDRAIRYADTRSSVG